MSDMFDMSEITSRRLSFPRKRKTAKQTISKESEEFGKEVDKRYESEAYKRRERRMLEADALQKEVDDFYDFD